MKVDIIAGARPNFVKIAPLIHAIKNEIGNGANIAYRLVHTGQHYDKLMSDSFFEDLNIPQPDINLNCGGGSQAEQAAAIMIAYERLLLQETADIVIVVGDVTSTMACSIVAKKMSIKVAHIEAGIRSFDLSMPEEINRMVTDSITDYFFTTSTYANENLQVAGVADDRIFFVGNVMIDSLLKNRERFRQPVIYNSLNLVKGNFIVLTLHRPSNVDDADSFKELVLTIAANCNGIPIVFPVHPRTAKVLDKIGLIDNLHFIEPLGYLEFNFLVENSKAVITDSGGITEETTIMGIPCLSLRDNTERPETVQFGTNELVGTGKENIIFYLRKLIAGNWKSGTAPTLWDGNAAVRIVNQLLRLNL